MTVIFNDQTSNRIASQARAELYARIYKYAAEDFVNHQDFETYIQDLSSWIISMEERLQALGTALSTHTHMVPPHVHNIPPHTHNTVPHFHVGNLGYPTSPDVVIVLPATPGATSLSSEFPSNPPVEPGSLTWKTGNIPKMYVNTSGVATNLNNKVVVSSGIIGDFTPEQRRSSPIPEAMTPLVPPYATPQLG